MQLKKIEMQGFKSFADKTTIEFTDGVTAIVGPNGSGKSNIIEAIQWVMGETSAKNLRGGKMPDIIFSGSDSRKPVNLAEVTLVLDNQDYFLPVEFEEVAITRRLNRNGNSDYFINKQSCRLKDIVDLFMDSGLGKESFSVISQGQVEAVFNSKPEDRRTIFEEAAGVLKYKNRKKQAEQKLDETKDNLDRVQDILYELENQLEPLKRESSIAKAYLEQKDELTQLDISVTAYEIHQLDQGLKEKNKQLEQYGKEYSLLEEKITSQQNEVDTYKTAVKKLEKDQDSIHHELLSIVQSYERAEAANKLMDERSKHSAEQVESLKKSVEKLNQEKNGLQHQLKLLQESLEKNQKVQKKQLQEIKQLEQQRDRLEGNKEAVMEELRDEYIDNMQQQSALKNERTYVEKNIQTYRTKKEGLEKELNQSENAKKETELRLNNVSVELKAVQKDIQYQLERYAVCQTEYNQSKQLYEEGTGRIQEAVRILQEAKAKRNSLKELQENYAGYFQGVREIMNESDRLEGIIGTVAELLEVPKKYQTAIDTALGASSQFVVVENEEAGRKGIDYLKQARKGRATFLPLTAIRSRKIPIDALRTIQAQQGFLGVASDLISFDERVSAVMENLLGNTIVADTLSSAVHLAKQLKHRYRIVSLDGDVMNAGGSMTGGARKKSSSINLFSQKNELQNLSVQIKQMEKTLGEKEAEMGELKRIRGKQALEMEDLKETGEQQRWEERRLQNELETLTEKKTQLEKQLTASRYELSETEEEIQSSVSRLEAVAEKLAETTQHIESLKQEMENVSVKWENRSKEKERLNQKIRSQSEVLSTSKEEAAAIRKEISVVGKQAEGVELELDEAQEAFSSASVPYSGRSKEETEIDLQQLAKEKETLENTQQKLKETRKEADSRLQEAEAALSDSQSKKQTIQTVQSACEIEVNRIDVQLDHLLDYLREEYKISYEEALKQMDAEMDTAETKKRVQLLKKGIEELGPVNLGAIEDYEKVSARWEFLTLQKNDLLDAKNSLNQTMDEMDQEVIRRFTETFEQIKERFAVVFPRMFGGGKAELVLTDPDDLLHSGVDIIAQPPGKKLQHLSLLSGGERALTAISLLFSIIQVRPIPFCILDEAEAALDEANVIRFGRYLHTFDEDIQFIVITHRKGTMEEANTLYGVTMQEKGVSNLVSVRLKDVGEKITVQ